MARSYLPQALAAFSTWIANFAALITAAPGTYGLVAADAATIQTANDAFQTAYTMSTAPTTRSPTTVQATVTARNTAVQVVRAYGRLILANAGVSDDDKVALGLHIRDAVNTPVPAPLTNPIIGVLGAQPGQLTVTYKDSAAAPKVKAKPFGATACQLFVQFGIVAPVSPAATPFYGVATKTPFPINCPAGSAGQNAYIYARWITQRGLVGPWSPLAVTAVI
jgi:hypothetical protein